MRIVTGPESARVTYLFAHGAGAPMDSAFMTTVAKGLAEKGVRVVRFEFPYMAERRATGRIRPPDRAPALLECYRSMVAAERSANSAGALAIGGMSMGGRIASMIADEARVDALVCFSYPFWPPRKPAPKKAKAAVTSEEKARDDARIHHLVAMQTRALILQGTRDPFGGEGEVATIRIAPEIVWIPDGDHGLAPRKRGPRAAPKQTAPTGASKKIAGSVRAGEPPSLAANLRAATDHAAAFLLALKTGAR